MSTKNREFLQLSHVHKKQDVGGWFASSKLDGFRVVWDGGVTRGKPKAHIPWANCDKDSRYVEAPIATGLWSRYGNVVHAPAWFLDRLPKGVCLDGEMYNAGMSRQQVRSVCAKLDPDPKSWEPIEFHVFSRLSPKIWLQAGRINNPNFKEKILGSEAYEYYLKNGGTSFGSYTARQLNDHLLKQSWWHQNLKHVKQTVLPYGEETSDALLQLLEAEMVKEHGEGLILVDPYHFNTPKRVAQSLKVKPRDSSEAKIVGYITGRVGKLQGMLGAVVVEWEGKRLELSGFTDAERNLPTAGDWAYVNVETETHEPVCPAFPIGHMIGFTYRGLTDDGVPNEAVYCRIEGCYEEKHG